MPSLRPPRCAAPDPDDRRTGACGVEMKPLAERHPAFGPSYRPGVWVFLCPRCGAVRAIDAEAASRYVSTYR